MTDQESILLAKARISLFKEVPDETALIRQVFKDPDSNVPEIAQQLYAEELLNNEKE